MIEVLSLLTLPKSSSNAFTALRSNAIDTFDTGSASPRPKAARLDTDSDAASASRSNRHSTSDGPFKIKIIGEEPKKTRDSDRPYALVRQSIRLTLTRNSTEPLPASYETIYAACRFVVTISNKGEGLYESLKMELERSLDRVASGLESFEPEKDRGDIPSQHYLIGWITEFVKVLDWFEQQVNRLQGLLTFLNQVYVPSTPNSFGIRELAYKVFRTKVFENLEIASILRARVKQWAEYERQLQLENPWREDIKKLITHLVKHQQYSAFEEYYVQITSDFYTAESEETAERLKNRPMTFFKDARNRIEQEIQRSKDVLPVGSWSLLRETTERALWAGRLEWLSTETLGPYLEREDERDELGTMYELFKRVGGIKALVSAFRSYVRRTVEGIVRDQTQDEDMVQRLLDFKTLADKAIANYFCDEKIGASLTNPAASPRKARTGSNSVNKVGEPSSSVSTKQPNSEFVYALTDAFNVGFKARRNKPAEMIAKYLDKLMRKGQGSTSDKEFEDLLDAVLALYRFTDDKDVFRTFYHRSLAKRLLLEKSASDDFEAAMLKKLKEKYDPEFGMGEDMFKDLALSKEMIADYHSKISPHSSGRQLNAMVLQRSAWPFTVQKTGVDLPPEMQTDLISFSNYYKNKHSGHVLDWDHALGTMTMKARFKPGIKELSLSLYQGIVLLLFNEATEWGFRDIKDRVRLEDGELRRTLQSLACGKKKVLKKVPPGKDVEDSDVFKFNADFDDPRAKVHINSIQAKVSPEESRRTNISIEGDRKHYLDAAIVRIMKAKKEMTYEQLKTATIDAVKSHFVPQVDAIKKRIDSLVESDYLERSTEDKNKFLYVA